VKHKSVSEGWIGALAFLVILVTGCGTLSTPSEEMGPTATPAAKVQDPVVGIPATPSPMTPEEAVEVFYTWYMSYAQHTGNPLVDRAYRSHEYLTDSFKERVDVALSGPGPGADPFLCAQDLPQELTVASSMTSDNRAMVVVQTSFQDHKFTVELEQVYGQWQIAGVTCKGANLGSGPDAMPPLSNEPLYQRVEMTPAGLSFEVPVGWFRLDPEWVWTPDPTSELRLGLNWMDLQPPMEAEPAMLPDHSQILYNEPVESGWAQGQQFVLEVYASEAAVGDGKASVQSLEVHTIFVITTDNGRRALDFYVSGPSAEDMGRLEPHLRHMVETSGFTGAILPKDTALASVWG
jgi:hypothetical protein